MNRLVITRRVTVLNALVTSVFLFSGFLFSFLISFAISSLPMHMPESTVSIVDTLITVIILLAAGAFWGRLMASITNSEEKRLVS